ncbi:MAG: phage tail protein [Bacillota bacterium]|nr:phage tail protein [Bacillota bacterium]
MNQIIGEIKLFPFDDIPDGWLKCSGQSLHVSDYSKLYMLIGTKFGKGNDTEFNLPNLSKVTPKKMVYCIAIKGILPDIHSLKH